MMIRFFRRAATELIFTFAGLHPWFGHFFNRALFGFGFEPQDVLDIRNLAIGPNKQNVWLTPMAAASYIARPRNQGSYKATHTPTFYTDESLANKGHQWATQKQRTMEDTSFDATIDLDAFLAGWLMFFCLGADTVTGAGPYTHTFKFLQSTNQMPVTTLLCQDTNDVIYQFPDMAIADLVLSGKESGPLQAQWKMVGSGKKVDGAVTFPAYGAANLLMGSDTDIKIGPAAPDPLQPNQQFTLSTVVAGALTQHTAFYKVTYTNAAGETVGSSEMSILVPANSVSKITVPATLPLGVTGVNVYGSNTTGTETKQAGGPVAAGGNLQEPNTGFVVGAALPTATTALSSIKERVRDWQCHIVCGTSTNRGPGGGMWGTFMKVMKQRANLSILVAATSADDMRTLAVNDTPREVQIITNSGAAQQLTLQFPCVFLETTEAGVNGEEIVWQMSAGDNSLFKIGAQEVFQAIVINNQAAYGVAA